MSKRNTIAKLTIFLLLLCSAACLGRGLYIPAKAYLSVHLLNYAWHQTAEKTKTPQKPWPWMDAKVIAHLSFPKQNKEFVVLDNVSGSALAFAPGWHPETAAPNAGGTTVIAAHHDTHFKPVKTLKENDPITMTDTKGVRYDYIVTQRFIVDTPSVSISDTEPDNYSRLILSTCHTDHVGQRNTQKRLIIVAEKL